MSQLPFGNRVAQQIKNRLRKYVGEFGLTYLHCATIINKELKLHERFKYRLNKNNIAGFCNREKEKIVAAPTISDAGKKLLLLHGLSPTKRKKFGNGPTSLGTPNRLKNAQLRKQQLIVEPTNTGSSVKNETIPGSPLYSQKVGKRSFIPARERRQRGLGENALGPHMPSPDSDLPLETLLFMQRHMDVEK